MFEFPQSTPDADGMPDTETIEGSLVVCLHDDPGEVEAFLRAIFDSSYFMPPPNEVDLSEVLGILRLAHKYDVGYLYKRAISHLETFFPIELAAVGQESTILNLHWDTELRSLAVLYEVGATWLLPGAYYSVVQNSLEDKPWDQCPTTRKELILQLCIRQRQATERLYHALTPVSNCDPCNMSKFGFLKSRPHPNERLDQSPLHEGTFLKKAILIQNLCLDCRAEAQTEYDAVRAQIWSELPTNCGLEGWDVLLKQREAVLA
ncbi:BTB domain-containing protein [Mycena sanguinolenta]|uniref:BTB domain-containing protein n=1 Tax=Mycena sanguinolenta TaxID=230812 RepID=A0A8H6YSB4_9AGAR|nr:BTB domain-containing protein [Mycena sanguinolenta]